MPIICKISVPRYTEEELRRFEEQDKRIYKIGDIEKDGYGWSQVMRRLETETRKAKGEINALSALGGNKDRIKQLRNRIKVYRDKYKEISDITGIAQEPKRMSIPRTPKKVTDGLKNGTDGGIINTTTESEYMRAQFPKGFKDETHPGDLISNETLERFARKANEYGIRLDPTISSYGGFETYRGDVAVIEDALERIKANKAELTKPLKNDTIILRYEDIKDDNGAIDVSAFAMARGRSITLNKFMYDDTEYLIKEYSDAVTKRIFTEGTNYRNVIDHEMGHIFNNTDERILKNMRFYIEAEAKKANMNYNDFVELHISSQAVYGNELIAEINAMRKGQKANIANEIWKEAISNEVL